MRERGYVDMELALGNVDRCVWLVGVEVFIYVNVSYACMCH